MHTVLHGSTGYESGFSYSRMRCSTHESLRYYLLTRITEKLLREEANRLLDCDTLPRPGDSDRKSGQRTTHVCIQLFLRREFGFTPAQARVDSTDQVGSESGAGQRFHVHVASCFGPNMQVRGGGRTNSQPQDHYRLPELSTNIRYPDLDQPTQAWLDGAQFDL